ncbi:MAG: S9 family peptidase [Archangium sp.]|nr:S9 family peptidase [Archangium sp.]
MNPRPLALLCLLTSLAASAQDAGVPLIARELLFGNPERFRPGISPNGASLSWLAPDDKNVLQVWVRPLAAKDGAVTVTADKKRGIRSYSWSEDSKSILFAQDGDGDENFHVFQVELATKNVRDLTPWQGVRAAVLAISSKQPNVILVTANVRDRKLMDVWRISLDTGAAVVDTENPGDVSGWGVDAQLLVRAAQATTKEGGTELRVRDSVKAPWKPLITVGLEEILDFVDFTEDGRSIVIKSSISADTTRLLEKSLKSGAERVLGFSAKSDVTGLIGYPTRHGVRAASFDVDGRFAWQPVEPSMKSELEALKAALPGDFFVSSMDAADAKWIVSETSDQGPMRFHLYDRKTRKVELLFTAQPKLEGLPLAPMKPVTIAARDGLSLSSYLTLPPGKAPKALPMVLLVHGGPWARDTWGQNSTAQWLANRGYAVLQVNFRGSTGYGKKFLNAANRQWGLAMHDDLLDAVAWAVKEGVADPKKVAIMGGSYGGYATLAGLAFTPDTFACGVDIVGPSNIFTLLNTIPPYWAAMRKEFVSRIGDPENPADKDLLTKASPLFSAGKIKVPLLIGQGANDPRVKPAESEQIVAAMEKNGLPVTYVLYPDEGHGFARPDNRIDFFARAEGFLAKCLGGRAEPLPKDGKIAGSTAQVKVVAAKKP